MGKATNLNWNEMVEYAKQKQGGPNNSMTASITLCDEEKNRFHHDEVNFHDVGPDQGAHVEGRLITALEAAYPNFQNVPQNATIFISCNFSPCTDCCTRWVDSTMGRLMALNRGIRLKMRYRQTWSKDNVGDKAGAFADWQAARQRYVAMQNNYLGVLVEKWKQQDYVHGTDVVVHKVETFWRPFLSIENRTTARTSVAAGERFEYESI